MIKIPFSPDTFSQDAKTRLSGINATFDFENIQSALVKSATEIRKTLGAATYDKIVGYFNVPNLEDIKKQALDNLQNAVLYFAFFKHLPFLAVSIGNGGMTTRKSTDETTAYKYQTDAIKISLIETAWFWMDNLYETISSNENIFSEWKDSEQKKLISELIVTSADFSFHYGIDSTYFFIKCTPFARKVIDEEISPRIHISALTIADSDSIEINKIKTDTLVLLKKAIVYKTLALACKIFSYYELPSPLRANIDNEFNSGSSSTIGEEYIRTKLAGLIENEAATMFTKIESAAQRLKNKKNATSYTPFPERKYNEDDKFILP